MARGSEKNYSKTYGDDAIIAQAIGRQAIKHVGTGGSDFIDGVISGLAWKGGQVTYAFPDNKNDYQYGGEKNHNFGVVSGKIRDAAEFILDTSYGSKANDGFAVEGFTAMKVSRGNDNNVTLRLAESADADPTAYGYFPNQGARGGDVWFGQKANYSNAVSGNYEYATVIHELGHALGLKHGHEAGFGNPAIPDQWDSSEYSVMTYRSYVNGPDGPYSNENFGFPQTYMMADIAALQHMYGANFKVNDGRTVYSWKPNSGDTYVNGKVGINSGGDNIFATIWDGGGRDKYDLSAYHNNVYVDLHAGSYSQFRESQLADLDTSSNSSSHTARGNIFNALQYKGDNRSLIEDAAGGSGNDIIWGNQGKNRIVGNSGNDELDGWQGNDLLVGGKGNDTFIFEKGWDKDSIVDFKGQDKIDLSAYGFLGVGDVKTHADDHGKDVVLVFGNGDSLTIDNMHKSDLQANDFILF